MEIVKYLCEFFFTNFWPVCDPDIPSYPYCRECLDKAKMELMIKLQEIDKKYKK